MIRHNFDKQDFIKALTKAKLHCKNINENQPVVIMFGGPGGIGKDTWISMVSQMLNETIGSYATTVSTIDPCKQLVTEAMKLSGRCICRNKDDAYRTFLHEIKEAWIKYDDEGYTNMTLKHIDGHISKLIFNHCREPKELAKWHTLLDNKGFINSSICMYGRVDPNSFTNEGDKYTEEYDYDMYIENNSTEEDLKVSAKAFVDAFVEVFA